MRMIMTNARATDKARTTTIPRWEVSSTEMEVQPVGKDERSKSSRGGGGGPPESSVALSGGVDEGEHGSLREKGRKNQISADLPSTKGVYSRCNKQSHKVTKEFYASNHHRPKHTCQANQPGHIDTAVKEKEVHQLW
jgi:hypothetical protein